MRPNPAITPINHPVDLLLIGGLLGFDAQFDQLAAALANDPLVNRIKVYTLDPKDSANIHVISTNVLQLIAKERLFSPVLIGYSIGAAIASYLRATYPDLFDEHLILVNPWLYTVPPAVLAAPFMAFTAPKGFGYFNALCHATIVARYGVNNFLTKEFENLPDPVETATRKIRGQKLVDTEVLLISCDHDKLVPRWLARRYTNKLHSRVCGCCVFHMFEYHGSHTTLLGGPDFVNLPEAERKAKENERAKVCRMILAFLRGGIRPLHYVSTNTRTERDHAHL